MDSGGTTGTILLYVCIGDLLGFSNFLCSYQLLVSISVNSFLGVGIHLNILRSLLGICIDLGLFITFLTVFLVVFLRGFLSGGFFAGGFFLTKTFFLVLLPVTIRFLAGTFGLTVLTASFMII
ncbi:hypothetical protein [Acanthamoeba polyphaga mimivirus]|uniref:Uncharacterized protein n=1 Tax=Acanthamoeba polyphaga mimivirus TaxID=212035 RepID=A0A0G2YEF3_MIMIV|nr:hypothetical protein [Acanthamoeba polyphaga mimivirus]